MTRGNRGEAALLAAIALLMVALGGYGAGFIWDAEAGKWLLGRASLCVPGERETAPCVARSAGHVVRYYSTSWEVAGRFGSRRVGDTYVVVHLDNGGDDAPVPVGTALTPVLLPPGATVTAERFAGKIIGLIAPNGRYIETGEHPNDKAYHNRGRIVFLLLYAPIWAFFAWVLVQMLRVLFGRTPPQTSVRRNTSHTPPPVRRPVIRQPPDRRGNRACARSAGGYGDATLTRPQAAMPIILPHRREMDANHATRRDPCITPGVWRCPSSRTPPPRGRDRR